MIIDTALIIDFLKRHLICILITLAGVAAGPWGLAAGFAAGAVRGGADRGDRRGPRGASLRDAAGLRRVGHQPLSGAGGHPGYDRRRPAG